MPYRPDIPQLPPLIRLPRDEVQIREHSPTHLSVALYTRMGSLYRQKVALSDLPNDLIGIEDLERAGVLHVYVAVVEKLPDHGRHPVECSDPNRPVQEPLLADFALATGASFNELVQCRKVCG